MHPGMLGCVAPEKYELPTVYSLPEFMDIPMTTGEWLGLDDYKRGRVEGTPYGPTWVREEEMSKEGHEGAVERETISDTEYEKLWAAGVAESLKERETHLRCWRGEHEADETERDYLKKMWDTEFISVCRFCRAVYVPK